MGEDDRALFGLDPDVPGLRPRLTPVQFGRHRQAAFRFEGKACSNRRGTIGREGQFGAHEMKRFGHDPRDDRQSIDAGIENAETARLPDPRLTRMPHPHILAPDDGGGPDRLVPQPGARRLDDAGAELMEWISADGRSALFES